MSSIPVELLSASFTGDVVAPNHPDYPTAIARWAANAQRKAALVTFPKTPQDVAHVLDFARKIKAPIAVRGGGHSAAGASSVEGGIVIDLSRHLAEVRVDAEQRLAYVGGGALWEAVDKAAIKHELATVGGTVNHTGVGGLILGGGYGWLTPAHGLVIDNLVKATVVTADGSILTASNEENTDLFYGIRGGGGNFGVVTEFVLRLHPQRPTVYAGPVIFDASAMEKIIETTLSWYPTAGENEGQIQVATVGPDGKAIVVIFMFYNGTVEEGKANFKQFFDIGPIADLSGEIPYEALNGLQNEVAAHGRGVYMKGLGHDKPVAETIVAAHKKFHELCHSQNYQGGILFEYFSLKKVTAVPADETPFRRTNAPGILILLNWDAERGDISEAARTHAYALADILLSSQAATKDADKLGYSNYDPEATASVTGAHKAFGEYYSRLQQIKKKFDPENTFNKWFAISPA